VLAEELSASTHTIFLGTVLDAGWREGAPLGYFNRTYHDFAVRA
jgi:flavin reductase (DIM6/NTAB) family NADH-FMN oxidoreductase RutF